MAAIEAAHRLAESHASAARRRLTAMTAAAPASGEGWMVPVAGRVSRGFGVPTDAGPARGVSFATPGNARVVSPCGGRIVFAGPFRSFGLLLIVDCGGDAHVVMAGLARLDARLGQPVRAGEPVGVMPPWDPSLLVQPAPLLYVELRQGGQAIDPAGRLHVSSNGGSAHLQRTA